MVTFPALSLPGFTPVISPITGATVSIYALASFTEVFPALSTASALTVYIPSSFMVSMINLSSTVTLYSLSDVVLLSYVSALYLTPLTVIVTFLIPDFSDNDLSAAFTVNVTFPLYQPYFPGLLSAATIMSTGSVSTSI